MNEKNLGKIIFSKLVRHVCFQKGLNRQAIEIHSKPCKTSIIKLLWAFGFYTWNFSLSTKLPEYMECKMIISKIDDFLRTMKSGFRPFLK